jgi:hypothetical protein
MQPSNPVLATTRRSLHGAAELLLAGPQYRRTKELKLHVLPTGGFTTVAAPHLSVQGDALVAGDRRIGLSGRTYAELGAEARVDVGAPADLYHDGSGVGPDDVAEVDPVAAGYLLGCLAAGDAALGRFAPAEEVILWPEHFDIGITVDEINYGVSPGDSYLGEPYAYVGPWQRRTGDFWTAPFGAVRPLGPEPSVDELVAFFVEGRERAATDPPA